MLFRIFIVLSLIIALSSCGSNGTRTKLNKDYPRTYPKAFF